MRDGAGEGASFRSARGRLEGGLLVCLSCKYLGLELGFEEGIGDGEAVASRNSKLIAIHLQLHLGIASPSN
jgi:hypothetical protein